MQVPSNSVLHGEVAADENFEVRGDDLRITEQDSGDPDFDPVEFDGSLNCRGSVKTRGGHGTRSPIWKYFINRGATVECKVCKKSLKRTGGNTSNQVRREMHCEIFSFVISSGRIVRQLLLNFRDVNYF